MNQLLPPALNLNGPWRARFADGSVHEILQPGIIGDPAIPSGTLKLSRRVTLPSGTWTGATLLLKGAKYRPRVHVDGALVAHAEGGLAPVRLALNHVSVKPGAAIELLIELSSVDAVPVADASMLPHADRWRSNLSSGLWDDIEMHFDRGARFQWVRPCTDLNARQLHVKARLTGNTAGISRVRASLWKQEALLCEISASAPAGELTLSIALPPEVQTWSPAQPNCYQLLVEALDEQDAALATDRRTYGARSFTVSGKQFHLNGEPFQARGGSICWHRFCRDREGRSFAFDRAWFEQAIIARYSAHGANWLRPHLGLPPEWLLDLCDRYGLCVQVEWPPFHGLPCSRESLVAQLTAWIDHAERHPCCVLYHPWNETYDQHELEKGAAVIATLAETFPHLVWAHRDVLHAHRYWWSLFENLKLPFDSPAVFAQPIVVDEFGGNYLDGEGNLGGYPELPSAFLRFLGPGHTAAQRLQLQCDASARIAEYWRRLRAAGIAQFCSLSSWEDGNHHFLGALAEKKPKPVWAAMTAAWAPVSVSLDLWDRNFLRGSAPVLKLWFFNDTVAPRSLVAELRAIRLDGSVAVSVRIALDLAAWSRTVRELAFTLPDETGPLLLELELLEAPLVAHRVISQWRICLHDHPVLPPHSAITVDESDRELMAYAAQLGATITENAPIVLASRELWKRLAAGDATARSQLESWLKSGRDVILLEAGPSGYGMESVEDQPKQVAAAEVRLPLVWGLHAIFRELAEGDSCFHATAEGAALWQDLAPENTCLWNGMRGGTVLPCWDLYFEGLHAEAFLQQWRERGANPDAIQTGRCFAYEVAGFYAFASERDPATEAALRTRVEFLFADAPALHSRVNPKAPIVCTDLHAAWLRCGGAARSITTLAVAGKNLRRTPLVLVEFGPESGRLVVSQLITTGRLAPNFARPDYPEPNPHYALRVDPAARIFVRNIITYLSRPPA